MPPLRSVFPLLLTGLLPFLLAACGDSPPGDAPSPASGAAAAGRSAAADEAAPAVPAAMQDEAGETPPDESAPSQTGPATDSGSGTAGASDPAETSEAEDPVQDAAGEVEGGEPRNEEVDDEAPLRAAPPPPGPDLPAPDENGVITINWDDLLPEGELERIQRLYDSAYSTMEMNHFGGQMPQIGTFSVEEALIGQTVRMPGFILPLDYQPGGEIDEFLLVPYFGACIHTPPPPPNQIVYVTLDAPIRVDRLWDPIWATGELTSDRHINELGDAAYTMRLTAHEPYE